MNIYIDDSIHSDHDFMLLSFVICKHDPQNDLQKILSAYDLDEFHSCRKMNNNDALQEVRSKFRAYINNTSKWGVFVLPNNLRHDIFLQFSEFITHLERKNLDKKLDVYIDQGILTNEETEILTTRNKITSIYNCDSAKINGIQLADLVASICGVRLREELSGNPKLLMYGKESGFEPPIEAKLGYELWASLRYSMFKENKPIGENMPDMASFNTKGYGFLLSEKVSKLVAGAATKLFSEIYLGCIH